MKRILIPLFILFMALPATCTAFSQSLQFTDVPPSQWYWDSVNQLAARGGISGYEDGSFRPEKSLTKGEFLALLINVFESDIQSSGQEHWALNYYGKAIDLGLIEEEDFPGTPSALDEPANRYEMALLLIRASEILMDEPASAVPSNLNEYISDYDSIPSKYKGAVTQAYCRGLLAGYSDGSFSGSRSLTRAESAAVILRLIDNSRQLEPSVRLEKGYYGGMDLDGMKIDLGITRDELLAEAGVPDFIAADQYDTSMYIYGTGDYKNFFLVQLSKNNVVLAINAVGSNFQTIETESTKAEIYQDSFGEKTVYGAKVAMDIDYLQAGLIGSYKEDFDSKAEGYSTICYHYLNAYRVYNGRNALAVSSSAKDAAVYKSTDMASKDYFAHDSLDGKNHVDLLSMFGLKNTNTYSGENLTAGYRTGIEAAESWIHSEGHWYNLLIPQYTHTGIGMAYDGSSTYKVYFSAIYYQER